MGITKANTKTIAAKLGNGLPVRASARNSVKPAAAGSSGAGSTASGHRTSRIGSGDPAKSAKPIGGKKSGSTASTERTGKNGRIENGGTSVSSSFGEHHFDILDVAWKRFNGSFGNDRFGGSGEVNVGHVSASADTAFNFDWSKGTVGAEINADARATVIDAKGEVHGKEGSWGTTSAEGEVYVGADTHVKAGVEVDPRTGDVDAGVDASAFAGGRISGSVTQTVGGVSATAGAEGWAGVGAELIADAQYKNGKFNIEFGAGAGLGVGGEFKFDISVDPREVAQDVQQVEKKAEQIEHKVENVANTVEKDAKSVVDHVEQAASTVASDAENVVDHVEHAASTVVHDAEKVASTVASWFGF